MLMLTTLAILLLLNAVWNVVVWPRFYKRVSQDARARDTARVRIVLVDLLICTPR